MIPSPSSPLLPCLLRPYHCLQLIQYHFLPVAHTTKDIPATPTSVPTLLSDEGVTVSETSPAGPFFVTGNGFLPPDSSAPHVQVCTYITCMGQS